MKLRQFCISRPTFRKRYIRGLIPPLSNRCPCLFKVHRGCIWAMFKVEGPWVDKLNRKTRVLTGKSPRAYTLRPTRRYKPGQRCAKNAQKFISNEICAYKSIFFEIFFRIFFPNFLITFQKNAPLVKNKA